LLRIKNNFDFTFLSPAYFIGGIFFGRNYHRKDRIVQITVDQLPAFRLMLTSPRTKAMTFKIKVLNFKCPSLLFSIRWGLARMKFPVRGIDDNVRLVEQSQNL